MIEQSEAGDERKRVERHKLDAMLAYCELASCRRASLLRYFGEEPKTACGNCDTCLAPPETWDATEAARKLLSAVYRTGQRFGAGYLIEHLRGESSERAGRLGHTDLSTFGIGRELDGRQWRSVIRQMLARGYLESDPGGYGGLRFGRDGWALLHGERSVRLRHDRKPQRARSAKGKAADRIAPEDAALWETLRETRKRLAHEQGVPAFVIFSDVTLREMLAQRPSTEEAFLALNGVGRKKLASYGAVFLRVIAAHPDRAGDK